MLTVTPGGRLIFKACLVAVGVLPLVTPAVADGRGGTLSQVGCEGAQCQVMAATAGQPADRAGAAAPVRAESPQVRAGESRPTDPGRSFGSVASLPSDCWVANLSGTCLMRGYRAPDPKSGVGDNDRPSPEVVARQAVSQLELPSPLIRMNPDVNAAQVVRVPTWLWIEQAEWRPVSKTAEVPGVVVTATATPQRVLWSMGDGGSTACAGPGTPYSVRYPAASVSPDCGYVYRRPSAGEPGEAFTVTATVVWNVVWQGGGKGGTIPGLRSTSQVPVRVTEVQGLVVAHPAAI